MQHVNTAVPTSHKNYCRDVNINKYFNWEMFYRFKVMINFYIIKFILHLTVIDISSTLQQLVHEKNITSPGTFPTRRYWPPRSKRFILATASLADRGLSNSTNAYPLKTPSYIINSSNVKQLDGMWLTITVYKTVITVVPVNNCESRGLWS